MRRIWLLSAVSLLFGTIAGKAAPEGTVPSNQKQAADQALADTCAKVVCRKQTRSLSLRASGGNVVRLHTELYPYLDTRGEAIIFPGETITLALPKDGNGPPNLLKVVDPDGPVDIGATSDSDSTLSFEFHQEEGKPDMLLTITSTVAAMLKYDATMLVVTPGGVRRAHTSTCPILAARETAKTTFGTESWPQPIPMLVISGIHAIPQGGPMNCT
ncbi:MAG TPA: hypothetical protein VG798_02015 [Rhizomicrobium sp.]|nr:hypothetical protein [Rhizomicrobium sp.]